MEREERGPVWIIFGLLPLLGLGMLLALIVLNGAGVERDDLPPAEDLSVQRVSLPTEYEFVLSVRNDSPEPVTLSQVVVNDAMWDFEAEPDGTIPPLGSATVTVPYSWVEGEAYEIVLITSTGTTFDAEVPVALLRRGREESSRLGTSYRIALGIGLHNLGEGLAIGAAFALGEAALGVFLVVGFTLHNITEGVGIAAPILRERPRLAHFVWLALLGGGPAIVGTWIGGFAYSNLLAAVFLAVGAGAILQVIYEVTRLLLSDSARSKVPALSAPNLGGFVGGVAIMYATALLV